MIAQDTARTGYTVFETALGVCGLAWGERGIVGVQLPEAQASRTRGRLLRRFPGAREQSPPAGVQWAVEDIVALLQGESRDLAGVVLDMAQVPPFDRQVYEVARTVPPGQTITYGEIAARLGGRHLAREVGQVLSQNPFAIVVPCHRVVAAGKLGGFSARGGTQTKLRLLAIEGAPITEPLPL